MIDEGRGCTVWYTRWLALEGGQDKQGQPLVGRVGRRGAGRGRECNAAHTSLYSLDLIYHFVSGLHSYAITCETTCRHVQLTTREQPTSTQQQPQPTHSYTLRRVWLYATIRRIIHVNTPLHSLAVRADNMTADTATAVRHRPHT